MFEIISTGGSHGGRNPACRSESRIEVGQGTRGDCANGPLATILARDDVGSPPRAVIDDAVAKVFGIPPRALGSTTRGRAPAARARQVAMYVTHVSCGMSLTDVGVLFSRDRTTVSHACAVIEDQRDDPVFDRVLEMLEWIVPELLTRSGHGDGFDQHPNG